MAGCAVNEAVKTVESVKTRVRRGRLGTAVVSGAEAKRIGRAMSCDLMQDRGAMLVQGWCRAG
jgi:hypothetical protein